MKKNNPLSFARFKKPRFLKKGFLIILLLISMAISLSAVYLRHLVLTSDVFVIRDILVPGAGDAALNFSYFKGRNIFSFGLKDGSRYFSQILPIYKEIRLIRILPNILFIDFLMRKPLAILMLSRNFYLDDTCTIFEGSGPMPRTDLVLIKGLEKKVFAPSSGKHYNIPELIMALSILKEVSSYENLRSYKIKEMSFVKTLEASIIFDAGLEVKTGEGELKDKIKLLAGLLKQTPGGISAIKYIDLRFQDTVVKFKNAK